MVTSFAARISACLAYMEAPGDESGNYKEIAQAAGFLIHKLSWKGFSSCRTGLMNVPKFWYPLIVFHHLARVMFWVEIVYRWDAGRLQIHKIQNYVQVRFRPIIRTDKTYVGCKYTNFITSSEIFQALIVSDGLYVKCQNTSCFGWSKSSL